MFSLTKLLRRTPYRPDTRWRPSLLPLEDRSVPSTLSSITGNFNGTRIPAGDDIWFSSVAKVSGIGSSPVTLHVTDQAITFTANGTPYTVDVPDTDLTLTPGATSAATTFAGGWHTSAPASFSGNVFLGGAVFEAVGGLPSGIKNVTWTASFYADTAGLTVNWQWAAAVYTQFSTDGSALNVKPVDDNKLSLIKNSDHAGTPESFKAFVVGGATGGGGSNWTGSYSATKSVKPDVGVAPAASISTSISGYVYADYNGNGLRDATDGGFSGMTVTLTGIDSHGNAVFLTTTTDAYGYYSFAGLSGGTYSLSLTHGTSFLMTGVNPGKVNGLTDGIVVGESLGSIVLNDGDLGIEYNFGGIVLG